MPPTDECERCRWWREGWGRAWCALPHDRAERVERGRRVCEDYDERRGGPWAALVYGNGDIRWRE